MYEVVLERAAERDLRRFSLEMFQRVIDHIKAFAETPRAAGCHKITGSKSDWRIRVGNYRIIYEIDEKGKAIRVMRIRHRREAYR
jgi:mRNA interferase RelE/StbE